MFVDKGIHKILVSVGIQMDSLRFYLDELI